jgi:hypothetical protein
MDLINAAFELSAALFVGLNALDIYRKQTVAGHTIPTTMFFWAWGLWNLAYYPHLDQWLSTSGALGVWAANTVLLVLVLKHRKPA